VASDAFVRWITLDVLGAHRRPGLPASGGEDGDRTGGVDATPLDVERAARRVGSDAGLDVVDAGLGHKDRLSEPFAVRGPCRSGWYRGRGYRGRGRGRGPWTVVLAEVGGSVDGPPWTARLVWTARRGRPVWSAKNRIPSLKDEGVRKEMHSYLAGACKNMGSPPLKVGGVEDHVHVACRLSRKIAISDLVKGLKKESSK